MWNMLLLSSVPYTGACDKEQRYLKEVTERISEATQLQVTESQ